MPSPFCCPEDVPLGFSVDGVRRAENGPNRRNHARRPRTSRDESRPCAFSARANRRAIEITNRLGERLPDVRDRSSGERLRFRSFVTLVLRLANESAAYSSGWPITNGLVSSVDFLPLDSLVVSNSCDSTKLVDERQIFRVKCRERERLPRTHIKKLEKRTFRACGRRKKHGRTSLLQRRATLDARLARAQKTRN